MSRKAKELVKEVVKSKTKEVYKIEDPVNQVVPKVDITISKEAYIEMTRYAQEFDPNECSGMGIVRKTEYTDDSISFEVEKVYLPNQYNTPSTTDIPDQELAKLICDLIAKEEDPSLLKFHWHSHVKMSVFHSYTDTENYDDLKTGDYLVSLVINLRGEMLGSVHIYKPLRIDILNIKVEVPELDEDDIKLLPEPIAKRITDNVARVKAEEEALREANKPKWKNHTISEYESPSMGFNKWGKNKNNFNPYKGYSKCYGLVHDKNLEYLLKAGEEEGLIQLMYDEHDTTKIIGFMNMNTYDCYALDSWLDYSITPGVKTKTTEREVTDDGFYGLCD